MTEKKLTLGFRGRVIDHLGIQMYQSPVAAVAELVSNAWDADSTQVEITLPDRDASKCQWKIIVKDNGNGMTFDECQKRFLDVGYDRRKGNTTQKSETLDRPLMGRKGIGKFAGFGIAEKVTIETTSHHTGETTKFALDINVLREGDTYVNTDALTITPEHTEKQDNTRPSGTTITLENLLIDRALSTDLFKKSMALRFSVNTTADNFKVLVNGEILPEPHETSKIELVFPKDFEASEIPNECLIDDEGFGVETLADGNRIRWKMFFYRDPIPNNELRGISIYAHGKLAQRPFMFNLAGGLTSQTGPEYLSGMITADYLDEQEKDLISTERQRINWEHPSSNALETWGQSRIKKLLGIWKNRRIKRNEALLTEKISQFANRLDRLQKHERKTVERALRQLASIERLSQEQFIAVSESILTAWEDGKLRDLIHELSEQQDMSEDKLLGILMESGVINALHTAEAVRMKVEVIQGLENRIHKRELENAVRDYIANNPWLVSPKWETFAVEKSIDNLMKQAAQEEGLDKADWQGRIDLAFSSGEQLLILEFMRPKLKIDKDHLSRLQSYVYHIRVAIEAATASPFKKVTGYIVADEISKSPVINKHIQQLAMDDIYCTDWDGLLTQAKKQWQEFLNHIKQRAPKDDRIDRL